MQITKRRYAYGFTALLLLSFTIFPFFQGISPTGIVIPRILILLLSAIFVRDCLTAKSNIWLTVFFLYSVLVNWTYDISSVISYYMEFAIPFVLSEVLLTTVNEKEKTLFYYYSVVIIVVTVISSTFALLYYDNDAIRNMVQFSNDGQMEMANHYHLLGVCDYDFAAMCMCVPAVFIYMYKINTKKVIKLLSAISVIISLFFMYKAQVTTTMLICVFLTFAAIIIRPQSSNVSNAILIIMGLSIFFSIGFLNIYEVIVPFISDTGMGTRIGGLIGQEDNSDWETRLELYYSSMEAFNNNILFGTTSAKIGGHNFFLDRLAMYGIVGVIPFAAMLISQYKRVISHMGYYQSLIYKMCWVGLIVLGFLKNMSGICYWLFIFFLIPAILLYNKETVNKIARL